MRISVSRILYDRIRTLRGLGDAGGGEEEDPFTPASLFSSGEQGVWYDPSDITTMYTVWSALNPGGAKVTAGGDSVGLWLNKAQGYGAEKITNGTFDTDTTGWMAENGGSLSVVGGQMSITSGASQTIATTAARYYRFKGTATPGTGNVRLLIGGGYGQGQIYDSGSLASATNFDFVFYSDSFTAPVVQFFHTGGTQLWDNVSVKEVLGPHAFTQNSNARPIYRTDDSIHWLEHDGVNDQLAVNLPDLGSDATLAYVNQSGVTILTSQTISSWVGLPNAAKQGPIIYINRPLTVDETANLTTYLTAMQP